MGQREFRGLEIYSPIDAGVSVGRGQNKVSGEDYFSGLAVLLPFGRFRFGWRVWHEESIDRETESPSLRTRLRPWLYHLFVAVAVVFVVWFVDKGLTPGDYYIRWMAFIWGGIVGFQLFLVALPTVVESILGCFAWMRRRLRAHGLTFL